MSISLILMSAGDSNRFANKCKKQWLRVDDKPLWLHVAENFIKIYNFEKIIITANENEINYMKKYADFHFVLGGKSRQESLQNALMSVDSEHVLVSDVARACIDSKVVLELIANQNEAEAIVPCINSVDTIHFKGKCIDRNEVIRIQTPQLSKTAFLKESLRLGEFTDESSAIISNSGKVKYIKGSETFRKLTFKEDLKHLSSLKSPCLDHFIGNGFDVHAFGENRPLLLGGVKVHDTMGLKAHSDGDVLAHALTDALLGAIGAGDIGDLYPDTDPKNKNISSMKILQNVVNFVYATGFEIVNSDIIILAEQPKLYTFKQEIAANVAKMLQIKNWKVNVKATTLEKMGFIGRNEGIGVMANVSLKFYDWSK